MTYQKNQHLRREDLRALLLKVKHPTDKAIPQTLPNLLERWSKDKTRLDSFLPAQENNVPPDPTVTLNEVLFDETTLSTNTRSTGADTFFDVLLQAVDQQTPNLMSL